MALLALWAGATEASGQNGGESDTVSPMVLHEARPLRVTLGLGPGSLGGTSLRAGMAFAPRGSGHLFSVRLSSLHEPVARTSPLENVRDIGFLYGRQVRSRTAYVAASAGVGVVSGMRRGASLGSRGKCAVPIACLFLAWAVQEHEEEPSRALAMPLEVEAGWNFGARVGVGATVFSSVNPERHTLAASLNVILRH